MKIKESEISTHISARACFSELRQFFYAVFRWSRSTITPSTLMKPLPTFSSISYAATISAHQASGSGVGPQVCDQTHIFHPYASINSMFPVYVTLVFNIPTAPNVLALAPRVDD